MHDRCQEKGFFVKRKIFSRNNEESLFEKNMQTITSSPNMANHNDDDLLTFSEEAIETQLKSYASEFFYMFG